MPLTPLQDGQTSPNRPETDNAYGLAATPTIVSGTAYQVSTKQPSHVYIDITTSAPLAIAIGPTSACAITVLASESAALGVTSVALPIGWWYKLNGTVADFNVITIIGD